MTKLSLLLLPLLGLAPAALLADEVLLRGGGSVSGVIVARSADEVKVDIGAGRVTVKMANVERIVESRSPLAEYRSRAAALAPDDLDGWRALAAYASENGLNAQAREAYGHVLQLAPDDAAANQAMGRVQLDGRWVSEEESYRARGFVELDGEWMTPQERQGILDERARREADERAALAAQQQEEDAAHAAHTAADQAYWEKARVNAIASGPPAGVVYWDAGVGPQVVPDLPVGGSERP